MTSYTNEGEDPDLYEEIKRAYFSWCAEKVDEELMRWTEVPIDGPPNPKDAVTVGEIYDPWGDGNIIFNSKDYGVIAMRSNRQ